MNVQYTFFNQRCDSSVLPKQRNNVSLGDAKNIKFDVTKGRRIFRQSFENRKMKLVGLFDLKADIDVNCKTLQRGRVFEDVNYRTKTRYKPANPIMVVRRYMNCKPTNSEVLEVRKGGEDGRRYWVTHAWVSSIY